MTATVLSPHFDDAILSCSHVLAGPGDVGVVNVFTAVPAPGLPLPPWDVATGARDGAERMRERAAEDRAALALLGRSAVALDFLDAQYRRPGEMPAPEIIAGRIAEAVGEPSLLLAPAAIGVHPDHVLVREAALVLAREGWPVELYADLPHAIAHGWPEWVAGMPDRHGVGALWSAALRSAEALADQLVARIRPLGPRARARKLRVLAEYCTQRAALDHCAFAPLDHPRTLAWEVSWQLG
jgi:LmbE family N-acetylglucosaminyl deacetylase